MGSRPMMVRRMSAAAADSELFTWSCNSHTVRWPIGAAQGARGRSGATGGQYIPVTRRSINALVQVEVNKELFQ